MDAAASSRARLWSFRAFVLVAVALATYFRDPSLFDAPRFWAEEGSHYFASAAVRDVRDGLANLKATPHNPYLHVVPQLFTVVASKAVPLRHAPAVTTAVWAVGLLLFELVVLFGRAEILRSTARRLLLAASPLLVVCTKENWVTSLATHFYLDAAMLLLLLEGRFVQDGRRRASLAAFTLFALLSPTNWFLLPAAVILQRRDAKAYTSYLARLAFAVVVHGLFVLALFNEARPERSLVAMPHVFASKCLVWPLFGRDVADVHAWWAFGLSPASFAFWSAVTAAVCAAVLALGFRLSRRDDTFGALFATYVTAVAGFLFLGIGVTRDLLPLHHGARYAWMPNLLLLWFIVHAIDFRALRGKNVAQWSAAVALVLVLRAGEGEYRGTRRYDEWAAAPDWREEVEAFWRNPDRTTLRIAPEGWSVHIPVEARYRLER